MGHHVFGLIVSVFYAAAADDEQAIGMLAVEPERMIASPFLHAAQGAVVLAWAAQHERQIVGLILSFRRLGEEDAQWQDEQEQDDEQANEHDLHKWEPPLLFA